MPLADASDRLIVSVVESVPLPRVFVWRDLRYVDDTQNQRGILTAWRTKQVKAMGSAPTEVPTDDEFAPGRTASLVPIAIASIWLGDWNTIGPKLGMTVVEKRAVARLLPIAFLRLGQKAPQDAWLVDPTTVPAG